MTTQDTIRILEYVLKSKGMETQQEQMGRMQSIQRSYGVSNIVEFNLDFTEAARNVDLFATVHQIEPDKLKEFIEDLNEPMVLFKSSDQNLYAELATFEKGDIKLPLSGEDFEQIHANKDWLTTEGGKVIALVLVPYRKILKLPDSGIEPLSPAKRLYRLLATEKKDIYYILIYALLVGVLSLALPLGLQTTVELISGGVFFSSVYILIGLVVLGVLLTGVLQLVQIGMMEQFQRRVFVKAALEFAYIIPRIRLEALTKSYAPELVNRFFDIITIQKGLPKVLLDVSSGTIQVFFGLLLLSLYHPFFVFFGLFLVGVLIAVFYYTGPRGLTSSINESKYKYKVVQWLEELARTIMSFKLAGRTDLAMRKTDQVTGNYIKYRKVHFNVLMTQLSFFVFLKVAITGSLLAVGAVLVVDRQITLGQFVASEVVIILVLSATEKIILSVDVVYDLLTAVDKVSQVTDLPTEESGRFAVPAGEPNKGYGITISNLNYTYPGDSKPVLKNINTTILAGERICISGPGGSGKSTLTNIICGLYSDFSGGVAINNFSIRDLDITHLRDKVAKNISPDDLFDGSFYENLTIGKASAKVEEVVSVLDRVGLTPFIHALPNGLHTHIVSGGKGLPSSTVHRIILGRCLAKKPALIVLNDFFSGLSKSDKLDLIKCVINPESSWTLVAVSNDPLVMASCDRVLIIDEGELVADDSYASLMKEGTLSKYFD
jgi:ABC-type bacteriocin/lantibiotic exporter with double-glycine peptidase domain